MERLPFFVVTVLTLLVTGCLSELSRDVNLIKFVYYGSDLNDTGTEISFTDTNQDKKLPFMRGNTKTTLIIDGFLSTGHTPMPQTLKNAIARTRPLENVIVIDWGALSGSGTPNLGSNLLRTSQTYLTVLGNIGPIGRRIAQFINFLSKSSSIPPSQIHIVGHSLGAHVAGAVGLWMQREYGSGMTLGHITGLDPAGPFFSGGLNMNKRIEKGDATFVDIYHTNRNGLGDSDIRTGDINVYINGGDDQPGCSDAPQKRICSHSYSWKVYASTFYRDIKACPCLGIACQCSTRCRTGCPDAITIGINTPMSARGAYHTSIQNTFQ